jgi:hypothetical protein
LASDCPAGWRTVPRVSPGPGLSPVGSLNRRPRSVKSSVVSGSFLGELQRKNPPQNSLENSDESAAQNSGKNSQGSVPQSRPRTGEESPSPAYSSEQEEHRKESPAQNSVGTARIGASEQAGNRREISPTKFDFPSAKGIDNSLGRDEIYPPARIPASVPRIVPTVGLWVLGSL